MQNPTNLTKIYYQASLKIQFSMNSTKCQCSMKGVTVNLLHIFTIQYFISYNLLSLHMLFLLINYAMSSKDTTCTMQIPNIYVLVPYYRIEALFFSSISNRFLGSKMFLQVLKNCCLECKKLLHWFSVCTELNKGQPDTMNPYLF